MPHRLLPLPLLASACISGGTKDDSGAGSGSSHAFGGSWTGTVAGHTQFEEDWETRAYCEGSASASVDDAGLLTGTGDCTIGWGPAEGEPFAAELEGELAEDGTFTVQVRLVYETEERSWERATIHGTAGEAIAGQGTTLYNPDGLPSMEGFIVLQLGR